MNSFSSITASRRTVLKLFGLGAGASVLGYSRFTKPEPAKFHQDTLALPQQLEQPRSVVVVGGGLAGLACAYELSQRGFQVTLLERAPQLGGKIASWTIQVGNESFRMEHGFHGFFPQYYNLNSLVQELELKQNFRSLNFYSVVYRDRYQPEVFRPSHSAFPWNIVDLAIASPNWLKWGLNLASPAHWQVFREITGFHAQKSYDRLDQLSVAEWVAQDFPKGLFDLYFLPFAKSSLNAPDVLSAAELMQFFHFYFFGNPEGLAFNGTTQDMGRSLVEPIAQAIEARGGKILTQVQVSNVDWQEGKIASLTYLSNGDTAFSRLVESRKWGVGAMPLRGDEAPIPSVPDGSEKRFTSEKGKVVAAHKTAPFWVEANSALNTASDNSVQYYGAGDAVYVTQNNVTQGKSAKAISLTCTHQGCTVQRVENGEFHCPCHGAVFDAQGRVVRGPAQRDLAQFEIRQRSADRLQLAALPEAGSGAIAETTVQADYYVFATDVPGVQQIFRNVTGEADADVQQQIAQLAVADPFAVARFWFDRTFPWEQSDFTSLSGYRLTDSITLYHRIQEDYIDWSNRTGGSVVELHAYCYKEKEFPTQTALLTTFEQELYEIVPDLKEATLLHRELVNQKNFSGYPPGSYADRPSTASGVPNLLFAGDWVKMPFPCGLMERAVSSGLLAANTILEQEGLQRRVLHTVKLTGVLSILT